MEYTMQKIDLLQGKENWEDWKFLIQIKLKGIPSAIEIVSGKLLPPKKPSNSTNEEELDYRKDLDKFNKTHSDVMFLLVSTLSTRVRGQIRHLLNPDEVW